MAAQGDYSAADFGGQAPELSTAGVARREAILRRTLTAARARRRRRQAAVVATGGVAIVLAGILMHRSWPEAPTTVSGPIYSGSRPEHVVFIPADRRPSFSSVEVVPPDPTVAVRLSAPDLPPSWEAIDDGALLAAVGATGRQAGIVHINGQTLLMLR
jgi:hypothetical protein